MERSAETGIAAVGSLKPTVTEYGILRLLALYEAKRHGVALDAKTQQALAMAIRLRRQPQVGAGAPSPSVVAMVVVRASPSKAVSGTAVKALAEALTAFELMQPPADFPQV
jgi:hypothetical protein